MTCERLPFICQMFFENRIVFCKKDTVKLKQETRVWQYTLLFLPNQNLFSIWKSSLELEYKYNSLTHFYLNKNDKKKYKMTKKHKGASVLTTLAKII